MAGPVERVSSSPEERPDVAELVAEYDEERPSRRLTGRWELGVRVAALAVALLVLKQVFDPFAKGNQFYLVVFLGLTLPLVFLGYRPWRSAADRPGPLDWVLALVALLVGLYPVLGGYDAFLDRQGQLSALDVVAGALLLVLVLEACRRTTGLVLPVVCLVFLAYAGRSRTRASTSATS